MRGASLRAVGELLGHQTMQMTMRYAHLSPGYSSTEIKLLDGIGGTKNGKKRATSSIGRSRAISVGRNAEETPRTSPREWSEASERRANDRVGGGAARAKPPGSIFGGPRRDRTCDPLVKSQVLYH